jgi:hypothetical protein
MRLTPKILVAVLLVGCLAVAVAVAGEQESLVGPITLSPAPVVVQPPITLSPLTPSQTGEQESLEGPIILLTRA